MAKMLHESDSSNRHLNWTRRHIRLCRRAGANDLAETIQPQYAALIEKRDIRLAAHEDRVAAHDDIVFYDTELDNEVRNTFDDCKRHDRQNSGARVLERIFPDGKFSTITSVTMTRQPDAVDILAQRVESLGQSHPIYPQAAELRQKAQISRDSVTQYKNAIVRQKATEQDEEIAKFELRRQYENNYLDARKQYGRRLAERLFPRVGANRPSPTVSDEETESQTDDE